MKREKILYLVLIIIAIVSAVIIGIKGLNFGLTYSPCKQLTFNIGKEFNNNDIMILTKEVVGNKEVIVQKVETYEDSVAIKVREISEDQINQLNLKINDKYDVENKVEDIKVSDVPNFRGRDLVIPYILPIGISLALIIVYAGIRFRKVNLLEVLGKIFGYNIFAELVYLAALAITRLPVDQLTLPTTIAIYTIITVVILNDFEKRQNVSTKKKK